MMWQCQSCKSYNSDGLKSCRCGSARTQYAIPDIKSTGLPKPRKNNKSDQSERKTGPLSQEQLAKVKEGRETGKAIRQNEAECVKGQFFQSQFLRRHK
jgi:hypothetical protein